MPGFTPLYAWVMENEELTRSEGMVVCRVLKYKAKGCWESSGKIGKALDMDIRTVQRNIVSLGEQDRKGGKWLIILRPFPWWRLRYLFINPSKLEAGPLYDYVRVGTEIIKKITAYNMTTSRREKLKILTA